MNTMNEKQLAQMEGERNAASDEYFKERETLDSADSRKVFDAAFTKGYEMKRISFNPKHSGIRPPQLA